MYRRRPQWQRYTQSQDTTGSKKTKVSITWSLKADAYQIVFGKFYSNFPLAQTLMAYMKGQPYGEYNYDPESKIWYLIEKHLPGLQAMLETLKDYFEVEFIQKQEGWSAGLGVKEVPIQFYLDKFKSLTSFDLKGLDYDSSKRFYRKACRENHPDLHRNAGNSNGTSAVDYHKTMSEINECWSNIERVVYKQKEIEYAT